MNQAHTYFSLRTAVYEDWKFLMFARNDKKTRTKYFNSAPVSQAEHIAWFKKLLADPYRTLLIAEITQGTFSIAIGSIRFEPAEDAQDTFYLSWMIDIDYRKRGYCSQMLRLARVFVPGVWKALIKDDNTASIKVAESNGFERILSVKGHNDGVALYVKENFLKLNENKEGTVIHSLQHQSIDRS